MRHPVAWLTWLGGGLVALSATRNPLYLAVTLAGVGAVLASLRRRSADALSVPISPWRFAVLVVPLSALFNAATVHVGRHVLFRLPDSLPLLGGPITLEALVFGALNGLVLVGIYTAFLALNHAVAVRALVGLIPRAFYQVAVVVSIALTFVPTTLRHFHQIREAQAIRGHHVRGLRDWLPLFLPLLIGGLERALQLAEAMTARGFAGSEGQSSSGMSRSIMAGGLALLLSGWLLHLVWNQPLLGPALMVLGVTAVGGVLWRLGRRVPRTTYRRYEWRMGDTLGVLGGMLTAAGCLIAWPGVSRASIFYYPYPALSLPQFDAIIGLALCGLLVPALLEVVAWYRQQAVRHSGSAAVDGDIPARSVRDYREQRPVARVLAPADAGAEHRGEQEAWSGAGGGR